MADRRRPHGDASAAAPSTTAATSRRPSPGITVTVGSRLGQLPVLDLVERAVARRRSRELMPSAVELGTKFRADVNGYITAIRFYKSPQNIGPHIGNLWTATGTLLATVHVHQRDRVRLAAGDAARRRSRSPRTRPTSCRTTPTSGFYSASDGYFASERRRQRAAARAAGRRRRRERRVSLRRQRVPDPDAIASENYWVDVVFATIDRRRTRRRRRSASSRRRTAPAASRRRPASRRRSARTDERGDGHECDVRAAERRRACSFRRR